MTAIVIHRYHKGQFRGFPGSSGSKSTSKSGSREPVVPIDVAVRVLYGRAICSAGVSKSFWWDNAYSRGANGSEVAVFIESSECLEELELLRESSGCSCSDSFSSAPTEGTTVEGADVEAISFSGSLQSAMRSWIVVKIYAALLYHTVIVTLDQIYSRLYRC